MSDDMRRSPEEQAAINAAIQHDIGRMMAAARRVRRSKGLRTRYRNGDEIHLACGCNSCSPSRINGVLCHEAGCPDAWRDYRKTCVFCNRPFYAPGNRKACLCHTCS
jgi:hypothetical protein